MFRVSTFQVKRRGFCIQGRELQEIPCAAVLGGTWNSMLDMECGMVSLKHDRLCGVDCFYVRVTGITRVQRFRVSLSLFWR